MELTADTLRGYLDYLRDLGVYDFYQSPGMVPDPAAQDQLQALLKAAPSSLSATPVKSVNQAVSQAASTSSRVLPPPPVRQPIRSIPLAQAPLRQQSAPEIVITPAVPVAVAAIGVAQTNGYPQDETLGNEAGPFAPPAMPLVSFNQLASLPAIRVSAADKAGALKALRTTIGDCTRCPLAYAGRHNIVFADGDPNARLMFVGEGPGADEDASGLPFVGKAGQLLNNMIGAMGLTRESVYIANIVMCRPPKNRAPEPAEANTCTQFLLQQVDIVQPKVIVALGATAATYLLGVKQPLSTLRGKWHDVRGAECAVTYHPAFLLRDPRQKSEAWKDLQRVMVELELKPPARG